MKQILLLTLMLSACATVPPAPTDKPADISTPTTPKPITDCTRKSWCWDSLVLDKITDNMLAANVGSFCPKAKSLNGKTVWLNIVKSIASAESGWDPGNTYVEPGASMSLDKVTGKRVVSEGLLQLSYQDSRAWSSLPGCKAIDYAKRNIQDPIINLNCGIEIMDRLAGRNPASDISNALKKNGVSSLGDYWSSVWMSKTDARAKMKRLMPECL